MTPFYRSMLLWYAIGLIVLAGPITAYAYVGPGAGITMIGALWALFLAIVLAIIGILFWPIRALLRRMRLGKQATKEADSEIH